MSLATDMTRMANESVIRPRVDFDDPALAAQLEMLSNDQAQFDTLDFGLVAMDLEATIVGYNATESNYAGIARSDVVGLNFFIDVAPCTNNYLVAGRFEEESVLDETIDYVLTFKMRPTPVRLRMIKDERSGRQYLAIKR